MRSFAELPGLLATASLAAAASGRTPARSSRCSRPTAGCRYSLRVTNRRANPRRKSRLKPSRIMLKRYPHGKLWKLNRTVQLNKSQEFSAWPHSIPVVRLLSLS
jgi:hypothetical protein